MQCDKKTMIINCIKTSVLKAQYFISIVLIYKPNLKKQTKKNLNHFYFFLQLTTNFFFFIIHQRVLEFMFLIKHISALFLGFSFKKVKMYSRKYKYITFHSNKT